METPENPETTTVSKSPFHAGLTHRGEVRASQSVAPPDVRFIDRETRQSHGVNSRPVCA